MKKYIILLITTALILTTIYFVPSWAENALTPVTIVTVKTGNFIETVTANGIVEYSDQKEVKSEFPLIPDEVLIEVGDYVEAGQVIATIDKEETCSAALNLLNISGGSLPDKFLETFAGQSEKISDLVDLLPEHIVASASGKITGLQMAKGTIAIPGTVLAVISDSGILQAKVAVGEATAEQVKKGQKAVISASGVKNKTYTGIVTKVYPNARKQYVGTTQQTVVDAMIQINQPDDRLKSGFSVKAEIETAPIREFPLLPYEAIGQDEIGEYIFTYQSGRAKKKYIKTGTELAEGIEILSGITAEDRIILGAENLEEGKFVRITATE